MTESKLQLLEYSAQGTGRTTTGRHESGALKYRSFELNEIDVRVYRDAAMVVCRQDADGVYDIDEEFRAMFVFVRLQGRWLLAGLQLSPISGRP